MKILIVEDHVKINYLITQFARNNGHQVIQTYTAEDALHALNQDTFDLIISDLMLPNMQGEDLIKAIRDISNIYIMVISAKTDLDDKVDVLTLGADDYITKPFSVEEVIAKLTNIEKRLDHKDPLVLSFNQGWLKLYPLKRQVLVNHQQANLTKNEYNLLWFLIRHQHQVFSRDQLINQLFSESEASERVIDTYIKNIRKQIDQERKPSMIKTHYGLGYQFVGEKDEL